MIFNSINKLFLIFSTSEYKEYFSKSVSIAEPSITLIQINLLVRAISYQTTKTYIL
jgi:hypothetical protein